MTVPVHPAPTRPTPATAPARLRLVRVPTPQPPLQDPRVPVRLVVPGVAVPGRRTAPVRGRARPVPCRGTTSSAPRGRSARTSPRPARRAAGW